MNPPCCRSVAWVLIDITTGILVVEEDQAPAAVEGENARPSVWAPLFCILEQLSSLIPQLIRYLTTLYASTVYTPNTHRLS
jgi:hypothetical protein